MQAERRGFALGDPINVFLLHFPCLSWYTKTARSPERNGVLNLNFRCFFCLRNFRDFLDVLGVLDFLDFLDVFSFFLNLALRRGILDFVN